MSLKDWFNRRKEKKAQQKPQHKKPRLHRKTLIMSFLAANLVVAPLYPTNILQSVQGTGQSLSGKFRAAAHAPRGGVDFRPYGDLSASWRRVVDASATAAGFSSGQDLYEKLPAPYKATLLNLLAKSAATQLPDGTRVLDHLTDIRAFHPDRIFANVDAGLAQQLDASDGHGPFYKRHGFDGVLHHGEKPFVKHGSYKTEDREGQLDITVSSDGKSWIAEMDVDCYRGFRHMVFEVMYDHAFNQETDPYKVEKILRTDQGIDPGYRLK